MCTLFSRLLILTAKFFTFPVISPWSCCGPESSCLYLTLLNRLHVGRHWSGFIRKSRLHFGKVTRSRVATSPTRDVPLTRPQSSSCNSRWVTFQISSPWGSHDKIISLEVGGSESTWEFVTPYFWGVVSFWRQKLLYRVGATDLFWRNENGNSWKGSLNHVNLDQHLTNDTCAFIIKLPYVAFTWFEKCYGLVSLVSRACVVGVDSLLSGGRGRYFRKLLAAQFFDIALEWVTIFGRFVAFEILRIFHTFTSQTLS